MNCYGGKYYLSLNSTSFYDLKCSRKDEIAYMWEPDIGKDVADQSYLYGCLNLGCQEVFG